MEAVGLTDQDVEELRLAMEEAEKAYMKGTLPLPRLRAIAPMWTIYSPESALSSSEAPQRTASPEAQTGFNVETTLGNLAMEESALDLQVHLTSVAALISTLMSLQAKRHAAASPGRSPCCSQEHWGRSVTKIVRCSTTN